LTAGKGMSDAGPESGDEQRPAPHLVKHGHHIEFRFINELKRRNVGRAAIFYLVV
jgi:hypothetical protein